MFSRPLQRICNVGLFWDLSLLCTASIRNTTTAATAAAVIHDGRNPKPFSEIPGLKSTFRVIIDQLKYRGRGHVFFEERFKEFGPIFVEPLGKIKIVYLMDVEAIENLYRMDAQYPKRILVEPWSYYRRVSNLAKGILIQNEMGEWKRMRSVLDKRMMRPKHVSNYTKSFNEVVTDFVTRLKDIRDTKGAGVSVPNLDRELFHWSIETIGTVLYERRFGGLSSNRDPEITRLIDAVHKCFETTEKLFYYPMNIAKYIQPKAYKGHMDAWTTIFATGKKLIDEKMVEMTQKLEQGEEIEGFLSSLLATKKLSQAEVYANISELMLGAVDTTSNTMQWVIYELSRNQDIQDKLRQEITSATNGGITDHAALQKMPYLKAMIKECLRLYPIAGVNTRITQEDVVLCGYHVPKDSTLLVSTYMTGRDPNSYDDPLQIKPERWLRGEQHDTVHSFAWTPFGFGPRMCIGRRVAELEMHLLTARLVQKFKILPLEEKPLEIITKGLMVPDRPVNVQFLDIN